ncbi:UNVERIFIED_CONTAM: hypothetical protein Slati_2697200 [Sesamum latifolium]|uniref:Uncharacterized protein n=1 Tax=Sesamum latifolium TaxID=2727402 RepID=A0AAW2VV82_9LAMI
MAVSEAGASGAPTLLVSEHEAWSGHYGWQTRSGYSYRRTGPTRASSMSPRRIRPIGR